MPGWSIPSPWASPIPAYKYKDVRPGGAGTPADEWNAPVRWPLYLVLFAVVALAVPAVRTYYRERL